MRLFTGVGFACLILSSSLGGAASARTEPEAPPPAAGCARRDQAVDEAGFVRIGGIEQWVTVKGASCANPVVLFLHGGPGNPLSPYADTIYAGWEKDFTLVQWDQRGAGRTFGRDPAPTDLTLELMTRDGVELVEHLRGRLGQQKVILLGGSWGSVLGVHMVKARPDLFHAYVGVSQLVSSKENRESSYRQVLARARAAGDDKTVAAIEALGPPPWTNPRNFGVLRRATRAYEAKTSAPAPAQWWAPSPAYATDEYQAAYEAGEEFSYLQAVGLDGNGMLSKADLPSLGLTFEVPVFMVQGAEDLVTTADVARRYFDALSAPQKEFRLLEATGHDPNPALIEAQYDLLTTRVLPLVR